jgi:hypothetical protein
MITSMPGCKAPNACRTSRYSRALSLEAHFSVYSASRAAISVLCSCAQTPESDQCPGFLFAPVGMGLGAVCAVVGSARYAKARYDAFMCLVAAVFTGILLGLVLWQ